MLNDRDKERLATTWAKVIDSIHSDRLEVVGPYPYRQILTSGALETLVIALEKLDWMLIVKHSVAPRQRLEKMEKTRIRRRAVVPRRIP